MLSAALTEGIVSNACDSLDPIELARGDVSRSKDVIAAATEDLAYHDRWLKDYLASEERSRKRQLRLVRRHEARQRRRIISQRFARSARRAAFGLAMSVSSVHRSLLKGTRSRLAQMRNLALISASRLASTIHVFSAWLLGLLFISLSWIGARGRALALLSLKASFIGLSRVAVSARGLALVSLRAASLGLTWIAIGARALATVSLGATSASFAWTSAKSRTLASTSLGAVAIGGSWLGGRLNDLAIASGNATSSGVCWARAKSQALALQSREAASISLTWGTATTRTLARALRRAVPTIASRIQAKSGNLVLELNHAASMASPRIRAAGHAAAVRALALRAAARRATRRQSERASLFALRLSAQAKAEIDGLRRAARSGELSLASWRSGFAMEVELVDSAAKGADSEEGESPSRNALICVEPWRCRLPAVRAERPVGPLAALNGPSRGTAA